MLGYYLMDHNMGIYGTVKVYLQSFLTSTTPPGKNKCQYRDRGQSQTQRWPGHGDNKKLLPQLHP